MEGPGSPPAPPPAAVVVVVALLLLVVGAAGLRVGPASGESSARPSAVGGEKRGRVVMCGDGGEKRGEGGDVYV